MQNWDGKSFLTENWLRRKEMWSAADIFTITCVTRAKGFLDLNFN